MKKLISLIFAGVMILASSFTALAAGGSIDSVSLNLTYEPILAGEEFSRTDIKVSAADPASGYSVSFWEVTNTPISGWKEGDVPALSIQVQAKKDYTFGTESTKKAGINVSGDCEVVKVSRSSDKTMLYVTVTLSEVGEGEWDDPDEPWTEGGGPGVSGGKSNGGPGVKAIDMTKGTWLTDEHGTWYMNPDRSYTTNGWQKIDGYWYYFNKSGYMKTGWILDKNVWYYCDKNSGRMLENTYTPDGYYVGANGAWVEGLRNR